MSEEQRAPLCKECGQELSFEYDPILDEESWECYDCGISTPIKDRQIHCTICNKESPEYKMRDGQDICESCRQDKHPFVQFCVFCGDEIRAEILDPSFNMYVFSIVEFSEKHVLGKHLESLKACSKCFDRIQMLKKPLIVNRSKPLMDE